MWSTVACIQSSVVYIRIVWFTLTKGIQFDHKWYCEDENVRFYLCILKKVGGVLGVSE